MTQGLGGFLLLLLGGGRACGEGILADDKRGR